MLSLYQANDDSIWIGTSRGPGVFNTKTEQFSRVNFDTSIKEAALNPITSIFGDKSGSIWFTRITGSSMYSLVRYNPHDGTFTKYANDQKDPLTIVSSAMYCGLEDVSGNIWVSGNLLLEMKGGVNRLNKQTEKFTRYLETFNVKTIYEDHSGTIWAGTDRGLYRYDKTVDDFVTFFDGQSELNEAGIHGMVEDAQGNLWVSTITMILKINRERNQALHYGRKFGIIPNFLQGAVFRKRDGELLISNKEGFYSFYPGQLIADISPSVIVITGILVNTIPLSTIKTK